MRVRSWIVGSTLIAASIAAAVVSLGPDVTRRTTAAIAPVPLPGHVLSVLADATRLDAPASPAPLTVTVVLRRDDQAGFDRYLKAVYDPASPDHRRFLTQPQLAARFGPSQAAYDHVLAYLQGTGLALVDGSANRLTLSVRGARTDFARALGVDVHDYRLDGRTFFATDRDPVLPADVARHVGSIAGLSDLARPAPVVKSLKRGFYALLCHLLATPINPPAGCKLCWDGNYMPLQKCLTAAKNAAENGGIDEQEFLAYRWYVQPKVVLASESCDAPPLGTFQPCPLFAPSSAATATTNALAATPAAAVAGTGQTVAIVGFDTFLPSDVADYLALVGIPEQNLANLSRVPVNGGAPLGPHQDEVLLDVTTVMTVAPGAKVVVYDAPFAGQGTFQALFNAAIADGATIVSNSWAYCEDQTTLADVQGIDTIFQNAAASGVSIFNASGDTGSTCLNGSPNTIAVPAGSPNATAVGASSVRGGDGKPYASESWWDGTADVPPTGQSGFGTSRFFTRPSYQDGFTTAAMRSIPDVVANGDPASGVVICQASAGGCPTGAIYGGTSLTAPLWAGYAALVNEALGQNLGLANTRLYPLAGTAAFRGPAALGTDFAHVGLGSPNLNRLISQLRGDTIGAVDAVASVVSPAQRLDVVADLDAPFTVPADGASTAFVVVRLLDTDRRQVGGKTVSLAGSPSGNVVITPASVVADADGVASFTVRNLVAENVELTATNTTDGIVLASKPTIPFVVPAAANASIVASASPVANDGVATTTITVTLQDALGRPTPGKEVVLAQGGGHSRIAAPSPSVTDNDGMIAFTATNLVAETVTYTAVDVSDGDLPVPGSAVVTFSGVVSTSCVNPDAPVGENGYVVTPFATGFVAQNFLFGFVNWGGCPGASHPAFRGSDVYVADFATGGLYRLGNEGGAASSANLLATHAQTIGYPAVGKDGRLYASFGTTGTNGTTGTIVELDPATGAILRTLASNQKCPSGLAVDPLSGDLFFTHQCTGGGPNLDDATLHRIRDPGGATPTVEPYATLPATPNGIVAFAPNGTMYVAVGYSQPSATVARVGGTDTPAPPTVTPLTGTPVIFHVTVADVGPDGDARSLLGLTLPGDLELFDLTAAPPTRTRIATDVAAGVIGPDGCMYVGNQDTVYKVSETGGGCRFRPSTATPSLGLAPGTVSPDPAQGTTQDFTATLRNVANPADTAVIFRVSGANPTIKLVRANAAGEATFRHLATQPGADVVVASAQVGESTLTSNRARLTWAAGKHLTFLTLNPSPTSGAAGQASTVVASLTDVSADPPTPVAGASIAFAVGTAQCAGTTDAGGRATCQLTPPQAGTSTLTAAFAGTAQLLAASDAVGFDTLGESGPTCDGVACDDGDPCTADTCVDGVCQSTPSATGLASVGCYLGALQSTLTASAPPAVRKSVRRQLLGKVKRLSRLVDKAGKQGRRGARALKRLVRQTDGLVRKLDKLPPKKLADALAEQLLPLARGAADAARAAGG